MLKKELVYLRVLSGFFGRRENSFTQLSLARELGISVSTVNNALKPLGKMGAVDVRGMGFSVSYAEKFLAYWASVRDVEKDAVYKTRVPAGVSALEKSMPSGVVYAAYSAYKFSFKDVPADYSEVYVYASKSELEDLKRRFPPRLGPPNLLVLRKEKLLDAMSENRVSPSCLVYVDLWNLREWYAKDFLKALEKRLFP